MFQYEEVIGIEREEYIENYSSLDFSNKLLLIPELIEEIVKASEDISIDFDIDENGFVNGYAIGKDKHSIMSKRGKITAFPQNTKICSKVSEDKAMVAISDASDIGVYYFIFNFNGYIELPTNVVDARWGFSDGLALCKVGKPDGDYFNYVNERGEIVSSEDYVCASSFVGGKAIVKAKNGDFRFINRQFKTIMSLKDTPANLCEKMVRLYDDDNSNDKINNIKLRTWSRDKYFYDCENGVPLFIYKIIDEVCRKFEFTLESTNPKEQLAEVLSLLATKGTYMLDIRTLEIEEVKVVRGVKIRDTESERTVISYDKDDYAFLKTRLRSEVNE